MHKCQTCSGEKTVTVAQPATGGSAYVTLVQIRCHACGGTGIEIEIQPLAQVEESKEGKPLRKPATGTLKKTSG